MMMRGLSVDFADELQNVSDGQAPRPGDAPRCPACHGVLTRSWRINVGRGPEVFCQGCAQKKLDQAGSGVPALVARVMRELGLVERDGQWSNR